MSRFGEKTRVRAVKRAMRGFRMVSRRFRFVRMFLRFLGSSDVMVKSTVYRTLSSCFSHPSRRESSAYTVHEKTRGEKKEGKGGSEEFEPRLGDTVLSASPRSS